MDATAPPQGWLQPRSQGGNEVGVATDFFPGQIPKDPGENSFESGIAGGCQLFFLLLLLLGRKKFGNVKDTVRKYSILLCIISFLTLNGTVRYFCTQ